ncbi:MAG: hypothetical protein ABF328_05100 [Akkermansiaceae bacterium]
MIEFKGCRRIGVQRPKAVRQTRLDVRRFTAHTLRAWSFPVHLVPLDCHVSC